MFTYDPKVVAQELTRGCIKSVLPGITSAELNRAVEATSHFNAADFKVFMQCLQDEVAVATNKSLEVLKATLTSQDVKRVTSKAVQAIAKDVEPLIAREAISKALEASTPFDKSGIDLTRAILEEKYGKK